MSTPRKYVQGRNYYLFGAGISATNTTIKLTFFKLPNSGVPITMAMFGGVIGYATLDPEIPTREENISFTGIIQNPDGTAELTGIIRGLKLDYDYTQDITLRQAHIGGSILRITNPVQLYDQFGNKFNDEDVVGRWSFLEAQRPVLTVDLDATLDEQLITHGELSRAILPPTAGITVLNNGTPLPGFFQKLNFKPSTQAVDAGGGQADISATGGGGGSFGSADITIDQTPSNGTYGLLGGAVNGINTTYTVSTTIYITGTLTVYLNGLLQLQGPLDDWQETTPGSGTFDFNTAPLTGDIITVTYRIPASIATIDQTPDNGTYGFLGGLVDGINTTFTVSAAQYTSGSLLVYLNGLVQLQGPTDDWQETTPGSGTFDFNTPPAIGDIVTVSYRT